MKLTLQCKHQLSSRAQYLRNEPTVDNPIFPGAFAGMLGARLKSWMEAQLGRAKKRKQKQPRQTTTTTAPGPVPPPHLSSPESAYSTGYSTDGTSPGTAPGPLAAPIVSPPPPPTPPTTHLYHEPALTKVRN